MSARTVDFRVNNNNGIRRRNFFYLEEFYSGLKVRDNLFGYALLISLNGEQMGLLHQVLLGLQTESSLVEGYYLQESVIERQFGIHTYNRTNLRQVPCFAHSCCKQGG